MAKGKSTKSTFFIEQTFKSDVLKVGNFWVGLKVSVFLEGLFQSLVSFTFIYKR